MASWVLGPALLSFSRRYPGAFGDLLLQRYQLSGDPKMLEVAEGMLRKSLPRLPEGSRVRGMRLSSLGVALRLRSELTGNRALLQEAEATGRAALDVLEGDPWRLAAGFNLAATLARVAEQGGGLVPAEEAVMLCRAAVDAADPSTFGLDQQQCRGQLGASLFYVFLLTGDVAPLEEAVSVLRAAADELADSHPMRAAILGTLGQALARMADRTGDGNLLQEAADAAGRAMDAAPPGSPYRAGHVSNLARILVQVFEHSAPTTRLASTPDPERTGTLADALDMAREAAGDTAAGQGQRALYLANLGAILLTAAEYAAKAGQFSTAGRGKGPGDRAALLREAVAVLREAVTMIPDEHPLRASYLNNLGLALRATAIATMNTSQLADAAWAIREAIAAVPENHPDLAQFQVNLANVLADLADRTADSFLRAEAVALDLTAAANANAPTVARIGAYRRVAARATEAGQDAEALAALEAAIGLAQRLAPRTLLLRDREDRLASLAGLASEAVAAALGAGLPEQAVELLEQVRGLLYAEVLDAHGGELARLAAVRPDLADSVTALRDHREDLERPDPLRPGRFAPDPSDTFRVARDLAADRLAANEDWDDLIARIREVEGFAGFFGPPRVADLAAQACDGPVVFVSASPARSDALLVTGDPGEPVRAVALTSLRYADVIEQASQLARAYDQEYTGAGTAAQEQILKILAWLWDTIASPVLDALGYDQVPGAGQGWPRLWWCPVGPLTSLPLHAAGHHDGTGRSVMDRVISSYAPTLRSLAYARSRGPDEARDVTRGTAVIVSAPAVPGFATLPSARSEAQVISSLLPGALVLDDPLGADVLMALGGSCVAHFACHAYTHWASLGASRLVLRDYATDPLTVADISRLRLPGGLVAYLSACSTAVTAPELADESVHIVSAFHLAGYQHVIGTLWPVGDRPAARLAADFYRRLTGADPMIGGLPVPAEALHHAVRSMRKRHSRVPAVWAAYIHVGM
jgi:CHAT domain-containing protein